MIYPLLQVLQTMQTEEQWELKVATAQQFGSQLPFKTQKKKRKRAGSHFRLFRLQIALLTQHNYLLPAGNNMNGHIAVLLRD